MASWFRLKRLLMLFWRISSGSSGGGPEMRILEGSPRWYSTLTIEGWFSYGLSALKGAHCFFSSTQFNRVDNCLATTAYSQPAS
ncbi:hypothetical protein TYRP_022236 [Tyrophagus putrescentiae]|nr:hypothetical protein TYRP_022236 [Tyrophagus putrescentiae]